VTAIKDIDEPKITVITVVFNGEESIEETIDSVINQSYGNVEYIVVDGGSTDGTLAIIKKYAHAIDNWVSEPDKGIYDAMNKGLSMASGSWVNFMNAGDRFYSAQSISQVFSVSMGCEKIIYGDVQIRYEDFSRVEIARHPKRLWRGMQFCHQSVFCDTEYHKGNPFNIENRICADLEFCYDAYKKNVNFKYTPSIVSSVEVGGVSEANRLKTCELSRLAVRKAGALPLVNVYYLYRYADVMLRSILKQLLPDTLVRGLIKWK
jgi:glycosyltransferase involved in cell wall biosynthesis